MKQLYSLLLATLMTGFVAEAQVISGRITDENNEPLPGAAVLVREMKSGTETDASGNFRIEGLPAGNYTLEVSYIGYANQDRSVRLAAGQNATLNIRMQPSSDQLDEVVIVGYGVQRKREVTANILSLDSKKLTDIPTQSFEGALQGKASGLQVITGSGLAGSGSVVRIRGAASISAGGDPLYIVDGIPITQDYFLRGNGGGMNNNPLATLNPNDIESVEVLKDAAATGIYGSRGANGVILITTKRGKGNKLAFNFNTRIGMSMPTAKANMLNSREYLQLYEEAWVNDGNVGTPILPGGISWADAQNTNTDWWEETVGIGFKQNYNFGVQKATSRGNFFVGFTYDDNQSYLIDNSFNRLSGRFNGDYRITDKLEVGLTSSISRGNNNRVDAAWSGGIGAAMSTALPIYPVYLPNGEFWNPTDGSKNPVAARENKTWRTQELRTINNLKLTYRPIANLTLMAQGSYDYMSLTEDIFETGELLGQSGINGIAKRFPLSVNNWNAFGTASYLHKVDNNNTFTYLLGTEFQSNTTRNFAIPLPQNKTTNEVIDAPGAFFQHPELSDQYQFDTVVGSDKWTFHSIFARVNYSYKDKYLAGFVFRADGSSKFGSNYRYGYFPSLSAGWVISEEDFYNRNGFVNFLKLKSSYGLTGNANLPANQWRGTFGTSGIGYAGNPYLYPINLENPDLKWETAQVFDISVEAGILGDRVTAEFGYYYKNSKDVFLQVQVPRYFGFGTYWDNAGKITNAGLELTLKSRNTTGELQWTTEFNIARNWNELVSIGGYSEDAVSGGTNDTRTIVGEPVGTNFLVRFSHVDPADGRPVYLDINGNPTKTWTPDDRVAVGSVLPDAIGGITNTFTYKGFDFSFLFAFVIGGDIYDSSSKRQLGVVTDWNMRTDLFDRWQKPGDVAAFPRLTLNTQTYGSTTPWINTDQWLHNGSYLRLRNLTLGYTFNQNQTKKLRLEFLRVYFLTTNLLTFTKFIGLDPEIARDFENATDRNMSPNITYLTPPQEKTFNIGIDVRF